MAVTLPDGAWRHRPGLDALVDALGADEARIVGGAVRDALLGIAVADIDIATTHPPAAVIARLEDAGIKVVPTGLAHGTVTAVTEGGPIEVTTLRRDVSTDGRHAVVAFTDDWRADAARRDFTINALYADPASGTVIDYFDGLADLARRRVRFIGDPYQRIAEDHLRILRFFRFHARFGDAIDADGLAACAARANDLMALSRERVAAELLKLFEAVHAVPVAALMVKHGILAAVLPEIDRDGAQRLARLAAREAATATQPDAIRRLAALIPVASAQAIGTRLKLSKAQRRRLEADAIPVGTTNARALAYRDGTDQAVDRLLLSDRPTDEVADAISDLRSWQPPRMPLSGGALIARGVAPGPAVARVLGLVERRWIEEDFPDDARLGAIADAAVAQAIAENGAIRR